MRRTAVSTLMALALTQSMAFPCEVGVDPKLLLRPPSVFYPDGPLPIVRNGSNAPEMLVHVYSSSALQDGVQRIYAFWGPCRRQAFGREIIRVKTRTTMHPGELYFIVPQYRETATGLAPIGVGWALRRATRKEENQYQTCRWS